MDTKDNGSCVICNFPATDKCSICKKTWYCGKEHQKADWKVHKQSCPKFKHSSNETFGNFICASRQITEGDVIFPDTPIVLLPSDSTGTQLTCMGCSVPINKDFSKCRSCHWPLCNLRCAQIKNHFSTECKILRQIPHSRIERLSGDTELWIFFLSIKVLRCLLLRAADPPKFQKLLSMESHFKSTRRSEESAKGFSAVVDFTYKFITRYCYHEAYGRDLIERMLGVVITNTTGIALFELASKLIHSCTPNTEIRNNPTNPNIEVVALHKIKTGEPLTEFYSFTDCIWKSTFQRRKILEAHLFICKCVRCKDPTELGSYISAIKCKRNLSNFEAKCPGYLLPLDPFDENTCWKCTEDRCLPTKSSSFAQLVLDSVMPIIKSIDDPIKKWELLNRLSGSILHENHFLLMELRHDLLIPTLELLSSKSPTDEIVAKYLMDGANKCLQLIKILHPEDRLYKGRYLFYMSQALFYTFREYHLVTSDNWEKYETCAQEAMKCFQYSCDIKLNEYLSQQYILRFVADAPIRLANLDWRSCSRH